MYPSYLYFINLRLSKPRERLEHAEEDPDPLRPQTQPYSHTPIGYNPRHHVIVINLQLSIPAESRRSGFSSLHPSHWLSLAGKTFLWLLFVVPAVLLPGLMIPLLLLHLSMFPCLAHTGSPHLFLT